jgi:hypothetical protein
MISQFAMRLICGMSLMWALMPRRQVTSGFFRIQMLVVMGLGVLAALSDAMQAQSAIREAGSSELSAGLPSPLLASLPAALIAVLGFIGSAFWTLERRTGAERIGFVVLLVSASLVEFVNLPSSHANRIIFVLDQVARLDSSDIPFVWRLVLEVASKYADAAVLGGTVVGMLLGHWYLTAPSMSIEPLKRLNLFLGVSGALRLIVSAVVVILLSNGVFDRSQASLRLVDVPQAWLGLRWLAGVIGPIVVSLMVWRILKYRNTQAATGVLFVGVILAFIGDMTAALLLRETGLPL